jgi:hypothetical protein
MLILTISDEMKTSEHKVPSKCWQFQKLYLRGILSIGRNSGISAHVPKKLTLEGINPQPCKNSILGFTVSSVFHSFWSGLILFSVSCKRDKGILIRKYCREILRSVKVPSEHLLNLKGNNASCCYLVYWLINHMQLCLNMVSKFVSYKWHVQERVLENFIFGLLYTCLTTNLT